MSVSNWRRTSFAKVFSSITAGYLKDTIAIWGQSIRSGFVLRLIVRFVILSRHDVNITELIVLMLSQS